MLSVFNMIRIALLLYYLFCDDMIYIKHKTDPILDLNKS